MVTVKTSEYEMTVENLMGTGDQGVVRVRVLHGEKVKDYSKGDLHRWIYGPALVFTTVNLESVDSEVFYPEEW